MRRSALFLLLLFLLLTACNGEPAPTAEAPTAEAPREETVPATEAPPATEPEEVPSETEPAPPVTALSFSELPQGLRSLGDYPPLEALDLRDCPAPLEELRAALAPLTGLKTLDLRGRELSIPEYETLHALLPETEIRWSVPCCGQRWDSRAQVLRPEGPETPDLSQWQLLAYLPKVDMLDLRNYRYSDEEMDAISDACPGITLLFRFDLFGVEADSYDSRLILNKHRVDDLDRLRHMLRYLPRLTCLEMCDCGVSNQDMAALREEYPEIKFVWMLHMGQYHLRTDTVAFSTLVGLEEYSILYSGDIQVLQYCTDLEALDLGHHHIRDLSVLYSLPKLRVLILADNWITDVTPIGSLKELRYLELFQNYNIKDISALAQLENLIDLNLSYCSRIGDLSPLYGLEHLDRVWLNQTSYGQETIEELKAHLPEGCTVSNSPVYSSTGGGWRPSPRHEMQYDMFHHNYIDPWFYENP